MKLNKYFYTIAAGLAFVACTDMDEIVPEGGTMLDAQVKETNLIAPSRAEASFNGMFSYTGQPTACYGGGNDGRADDWGFLMINYSNDIEGPDVVVANSGYNWFSVCGEYSSRDASYANPYIRYAVPYNLISMVNTFLMGFAEDVDTPEALHMIAQARAMRAYAYLNLVTDFQFNYQIAKDKPGVPIVTEETVDFTNNPRATVEEVYTLILEDLNYAVETLEASTIVRPTKAFIDANVAHGLRARAYLDMGEWQKAYDDAVAAAEGYTPATIAELSEGPTFMDISESNWLWGYDMTKEMADVFLYATHSSWVRSFSAQGYAAACAVYACINSLLYNKIPDTDVRKGWWVNEDLYSPLLEGLTWDGEADIANLAIADVKEPFTPYTNVKFGCKTIGTVLNDEDTPLMRVEEMILIQAECQAHLDAAKGAQILENFVKTYRDPEYNLNGRGLSLLDEIWFQRRVELWGEGFGVKDVRRLNKPLVRFHDNTNNQPDAYRFNMPADDPWLLMRFSQYELNTNFAIVDNEGGTLPKPGQHPELRDGVTD